MDVSYPDHGFQRGFGRFVAGKDNMVFQNECSGRLWRMHARQMRAALREENKGSGQNCDGNNHQGYF
jgi:hypothetical protein